MYSIALTKSARKSLKRIPEKIQKKIGKEIDKLAHNPRRGKKLEGDMRGKYVLRAWPYRIIYKIEKKTITVYILKIGHRQGIYE